MREQLTYAIKIVLILLNQWLVYLFVILHFLIVTFSFACFHQSGVRFMCDINICVFSLTWYRQAVRDIFLPYFDQGTGLILFAYCCSLCVLVWYFVTGNAHSMTSKYASYKFKSWPSNYLFDLHHLLLGSHLVSEYKLLPLQHVSCFFSNRTCPCNWKWGTWKWLSLFCLPIKVLVVVILKFVNLIS